MIPLLLHQCFTYGLFALSLLTNALFIWISTTTLSDSIGRYRYLMIGFATMDVMVSITHVVLMPSVQMTSEGYIFFGYHLVDKPAIVGTWAGIFFVIFFYQTFVILTLHYLYRYAIVCEPRWRWIFTNNTTFWWTFVSSLLQVLYSYGYFEAVQIGFMPSEYKSEYYRPFVINYCGIDISQHDFGYLAVVFRKPHPDPSLPAVWQNDAIVSILIAIGLFTLSLSTISICIFLIMRQLRIGISSVISAQMRKTQNALLRALIVQTVIPTVFSYVPVGLAFVVPFLGFDLNGVYGDLIIMCTAVFPALDPIIMLYFVGSYRQRIFYIWKVLSDPNFSQVQHISPNKASDFSTTRHTN